MEALLAFKRTESSWGGENKIGLVTGMRKRVENKIAQNEVICVELLPQISGTGHQGMTVSC